MSRYLLCLLSVVAVSVMSVGCCGPRGCGPGCGISACNDCDGIGYGEKVIPQCPFDRLRNGSLFCGSGCGEVYLDEWISTPPDSCDPCAGDQFVGGATPCRPFCWQRGAILRTLYGGRFLYGGRYSNSYRAAASCGGGCGGGCGCGGGEIISDGYVTDSYIEAPHYSSGAGCTTCEASEPTARTRIAKSKPQPKSHSNSKKVIQAGETERIYR